MICYRDLVIATAVMSVAELYNAQTLLIVLVAPAGRFLCYSWL